MMRSTREVFEDHLRRRREGRLLEDIEQDYAEDVVLLCEQEPMLGHDAIRESARRLQQQLPDGRFEYLAQHVHGEYAFLTWRGESAEAVLENGVDSFVIRDGRIIMQSIYYTVRSKRS